MSGRQPLPHTAESLAGELRALGLATGGTVMVHASLRAVGSVLGGPRAVVLALLDCLGRQGTLVMPAFTPTAADPAEWWNRPAVPPEQHTFYRRHMLAFDAATTPSEMGAISEAFRTWPGTLRSDHPTGSLCVLGPHGAELIAGHPLAMNEGPGTAYERLVALGAQVLLLGVGFESCTMMHHGESLSRSPRRGRSRTLHLEEGRRVWRESRQMGMDAGLYFPALGEAFVAAGGAWRGKVGDATATITPAADLVAHVRDAFDAIYAPGGAT